jgi:hypothetical protein
MPSPKSTGFIPNLSPAEVQSERYQHFPAFSLAVTGINEPPPEYDPENIFAQLAVLHD